MPFDARVSAEDLIPSEMLKLSREDQIERMALLLSDTRDAFDIGEADSESGSVTMMAPNSPIAFNNAPPGPAEWAGQEYWRCAQDLSRFTECQLSCAVTTVGATGSQVAIQAAPSGTFDFLDGADGPNIALDALGLGISDWRPIFSGFRTEVVLRVVEVAGDSNADPAIALTVVQFR